MYNVSHNPRSLLGHLQPCILKRGPHSKLHSTVNCANEVVSRDWTRRRLGVTASPKVKNSGIYNLLSVCDYYPGKVCLNVFLKYNIFLFPLGAKAKIIQVISFKKIESRGTGFFH